MVETIRAGSAMRASIDSRMSRGGAVIATTMSYEMQDKVEIVVKSLMGTSSCLTGKRPDPVPYATPYDPPCPSSSSLPTQSENRTVSIGIQATEFTKWCVAIKRDIMSAAQMCEAYKNATSGSKCPCTNTTDVQPLMNAWNETCSAISKYNNVTEVKGTLLSYCNGTVGKNLTVTYQLTEAFIIKVRNCSVCLCQDVKDNKAKMIKKCVTGSTGKSGEKTASSESEAKKTCRQRITEYASNYRRICKVSMEQSRKRAYRRRLGMRKRSRESIVLTFGSMDDSLVTLNVSISKFWYQTKMKNSLTNVRENMRRMRRNMDTLIIIVLNSTDNAVDDSQASINETYTKGQNLVMEGCKNFTDQLAIDAEQYPCCQPYGNFTLEIQTNFTINVDSKCMAPADNQTNEATAISGVVMANFTASWQQVIDDSNNCYPYCAQTSNCGACLNWYEYWNPSWSPCVDNVS